MKFKIKSYPILFFLYFFLPLLIFAQNTIEKNLNFFPPIKIPLSTSGYFGELRANHFHSGLDLRTGGKVGEKVYSPSSGEVSRIKIQAFGGGKNLYISHPNGYTSVYMHLQSYAPKIENYIREYQYTNKTYEFDIRLPKNKLRIEKGELIAYSGNTGSSGGAHLHYEIRNTKTENTINPLLLGLKIDDTIAPYFKNLMIYPEGDFSRVEGRAEKKRYTIIKQDTNTKALNVYDNNSTIKDNDTIFVTNKVSLGIIAFDKSQNSTGRNGVYSYAVKVNDKLFWSFAIDEFSFSESRYINACIDYEQYLKTSERFLKTKHLPNNPLSFFKIFQNKGIIQMNSGEILKVEYILQDIKGNTSNFVFYLQAVPFTPNIIPLKEEITGTKYSFKWNKDNLISDTSINILIPKNSFYDDGEVIYFKEENELQKEIKYNILSSSALHSNMVLRIKLPKDLENDSLLSKKLLVAEVNGRYAVSIGGKVVKDEIIAKTNSFGVFKLMLDTIAPSVSALNFKENKTIPKKQKALRFNIKDNLSGISKYNGYINDKWVLMEYDGKSATLIYSINPKELYQKRNKIKLIIEDRVGNRTEKEFIILKR